MTDGSSEPILLELADRGAGFRFDPELPAEVLRLFRPVVDHMLTTTTPQPQVRTGSHRLWSLQLVDTSGLREPFWCFVVQGRGGMFGAAGTCQFVFAPLGRWHPGQLWEWCTSRMDQGTVAVDAEPSNRRLPPIDDRGHRVVIDVMHGLAAGAGRIGLGHSAVVAATVLTRLLPVLPPEVVSRYLWSTCLVRKPLSAGQPTVAAGLPDDLHDLMPDQADGIDTWLGDGSRRVAESVTLSGARGRALEWFARDVASDAPEYRPGTDVTTLTELLDLVVDVYLPVTVDDVEGLMSTENGRNRLLSNLDVTTVWAEHYPDQARVALTTEDEPRLQQALLSGLWRLLDREPNPLGLPQPGEPEPADGWHDRLATLLRTTIPAEDLPGQMEWFRASGRPLDSTEALVEAAPWLRLLGMDRSAHPEFFPLPLARMKDRLSRIGDLPADDRQELLTLSRSPLPELTQLAPYAREAPAGACLVDVLAMHWATNVETEAATEIMGLTAVLTRARTDHGHQANGEWLTRLVDAVSATVPDPARVREITHSALTVLTEDPSFTVTADVRDRFRAVLADDPSLDPVHRFLLRPEPVAEPEDGRRPAAESRQEPATAHKALDDPPARTRRHASRSEIPELWARVRLRSAPDAGAARPKYRQRWWRALITPVFVGLALLVVLGVVTYVLVLS